MSQLWHRTGQGVAAWLLAFLSLLLVGGAVTLTLFNRVGPPLEMIQFSVLAAAFSGLGALVASKRPSHPIGLLLSGVGVLVALWLFSAEYAIYALETSPRLLPGGESMAWLQTWIVYPPLMACVTFLPLLFPTGHPPSRRWRWLGWFSGALIAMATLSFALKPGPLQGVQGVPRIENPFGVPTPLHGLLEVFGPPLLLSAALLSTASLAVRFRRSGREERLQIKWLVYGALLLSASTIIWVANLVVEEDPVLDSVAAVTTFVGFLALPAGMSIAVLKYRLYEVDLVISRTLVYLTLTGVVAGVYILVVAYLGVLFQAQGSLAISLVATGAVAVLFQPLRKRVQRVVDRLVYGERHEPYTVITRVARQLEQAESSDAILPALVQTVAEALKLPHASIWTVEDQTLRLAAAHGGAPSVLEVYDESFVLGLREAPLAAELGGRDHQGPAVSALGSAGVELALPIRLAGALTGIMCLAPRVPGEAFTEADLRLLGELAGQAGSAVRSVQLTQALRANLEELRHSRSRLVESQEEERRRVQRDLHDGLGPTLASIRLRLEAAMELADGHADLRSQLERIDEAVSHAGSDVRRLVYGLRPPVLSQLGLLSALRQHVEGFSRDTGIEAEFLTDSRVSASPAAEVGIFRVVQEALVNVDKHSGASRVEVRIERRPPWDVVTIRDNGVGFDEVGTQASGTGLRSMRERADLLRGTVEVDTAPGRGTLITLRIPLDNEEAQVP